MTVLPGLVGVTGVLFGSTAYDSFRESEPWIKFIQSSDISGTVLTNLALLAFCLAAIGIFSVGSMLTGVEEYADGPCPTSSPTRSCRSWPAT